MQCWFQYMDYTYNSIQTEKAPLVGKRKMQSNPCMGVQAASTAQPIFMPHSSDRFPNHIPFESYTFVPHNARRGSTFFLWDFEGRKQCMEFYASQYSMPAVLRSQGL